MTLKRLTAAFLTRFRTLFHSHRRPKRNYYRKPGQPCIPETLMECVSETEVVAIGDSYRRAHPTWVANFSPEIGVRKGTSSGSFRKRRQLLVDAINADFAQGNLTQAQGWILANSEAEQCARLSAKPSS